MFIVTTRIIGVDHGTPEEQMTGTIPPLDLKSFERIIGDDHGQIVIKARDKRTMVP